MGGEFPVSSVAEEQFVGPHFVSIHFCFVSLQTGGNPTVHSHVSVVEKKVGMS